VAGDHAQRECGRSALKGGHVVLIRVVTIRAGIPQTGEGIAFVHGELQPMVAALDGNRGFTMAVDRSSGRYIGLTAWTDDEAAKATMDRDARLVGEATRRLGGSESSIEEFDLAVAHSVKPLRVGYWGRFTRVEMTVDDLDRAVLKFRDTALPLFEGYVGLAAVNLFVNRMSGVAESVIWFDSLHVLRCSEPRWEEMQKLLAAVVPSLKIVEVAELQVVIAEMDPQS
jgi:hypothetical protein